MTLSDQQILELNFFSEKFNLPKDEILQFVEHYNADFAAYDNHIYEHIGSRIAHWWNFQDHNWFAKRIDLCLDYLERVSANPNDRTLLVDVGFSIPYIYTRPSLARRTNLSALFVDKEKSVEPFYMAITELSNIRRPTLDHIMVADIERPTDQEHIWNFLHASTTNQPLSRVLIVASEVVEHLANPETFWALVKGINLPATTQLSVYVTLPIGKQIPSHTMEFLNAKDAFDYLEQHLKIRDKWVIRPLPGMPASLYLQECVCVLGGLEPL